MAEREYVEEEFEKAREALDGEFDRDQGRLLTTLADRRQQADYGYAPIDDDVTALTDRTRRFVDAVGRDLGVEDS
ncbi:MAG: hypothetical protein ABEJ26_08215 [Halosimplex sp.]